MSWKPEVTVYGEEKWHGNALRFATKEEAEAYASDLFGRWTATTGFRAVECDLPVNYEWRDGRAVYLEDWKERREREIYDQAPELLK